MKRTSLFVCLAASGLAVGTASGWAQTESGSSTVQRMEALLQSNQGALLPLDGALDPALSSVLLLPLPQDSSPEPGLQVADSEFHVTEDGDQIGLPPTEEEIAAAQLAADGAIDAAEVEEIVAEESVVIEDEIVDPAEDVAVEEVVVEEVEAVPTVEAEPLPEIDTMAEIVTAELGNPTTIGPWRLWLASYRTVREAQDGWLQLARENRDVLADLSPVIVMKELGGDSGTFFRLQAGPLADEGAAKRRCDELKTRNFYCAILGPQDG